MSYTYGNLHFENSVTSSRYGFTHISKLCNEAGTVIETNKVHYINRTWEPFQFYTSMIGCIEKEINFISEGIKNDYKNRNNIKRIYGKHKDLLEEEINNNSLIRDYNNYIEFIKKGR